MGQKSLDVGRPASLYGLAFEFGSKLPLLPIRSPVSWCPPFWVFIEKHCLFKGCFAKV